MQVVSKASLRAQLEADPPKHPAALLARLSQMEQQLGFANASSLAPLEQLWCLFTQVQSCKPTHCCQIANEVADLAFGAAAVSVHLKLRL